MRIKVDMIGLRFTFRNSKLPSKNSYRCLTCGNILEKRSKTTLQCKLTEIGKELISNTHRLLGKVLRSDSTILILSTLKGSICGLTLNVSYVKGFLCIKRFGFKK